MPFLLVGCWVQIKNALKFGQSIPVKIVDISLLQRGPQPDGMGKCAASLSNGTRLHILHGQK